MKFAIFLKRRLFNRLFNSFLSFLFINKTLWFNNVKTGAAMNANSSVFVICAEAITCLL